MYSIYQAGIRIYFFLARLFSVFNPGAREFLISRAYQRKSSSFKRPEDKKLIWFHASSLGEYEQGQPLIRKWKEANPDWIILLTFFSSSGFNQQKINRYAHHVDYIPIDLEKEVNRFLDFYHPDLVVFIKYDIWPVLLRELKRRKVPACLVSSVFRKDQLFFKWYGSWYLSVLNHFSWIFTQDAESVKLLERRGLKNARMAGDTRIDRVMELSGTDMEIEGIEDFSQGRMVLVAGSSWPAEEKLIHRFVNLHNNGRVKIIIAPHDIGKKHIESIKKLFGNSLITYSKLLKQQDMKPDKDVLLIDRIGLLSRLYRFGDIAFIGGAFGKGLHNVLEPAVFGLPLIFGPAFRNFIEAVELSDSGAAFPIKNYSEFYSALQVLVEDKDTYLKASKGCENFVKNRAGATSLITSQLLEIV